jgi:RNA polymerase sigma-70 factor (ECF subfamily)
MDASEDIVQEFFCNLWKNRQDMNAAFSLSAYLFRSVHNNALHYLAHRSVKQKYEVAEQGDRRLCSRETLTRLELQELERAVEQTLRKLPERCARVFKLNRFEGKKYREIAEMLSISVKTVEADMGMALREFRETLGEYTGNPVAGRHAG